MADSTLTAIQTKVRRLTRSATEANLSTDQINEYINTFIQYDFPEHLRLFNLRSTFTFYTSPYVSEYETDTSDPGSPLYQFDQINLSVHPPIYIAGFPAFFSQSREEFYNIYPKVNSISSSLNGDGVTTSFSGIINLNQTFVPSNSTQNTCILRNNVLFSSVDSFGNGLALIDYPVSPTVGALGIPDVPQTIPSPYGQVNYITGVYTLNFPTAPAIGQAIFSQVIIEQPTRPQAMLFYDQKFILRPVPDQPYRVQMEVYVRPTELLSQGQSPELEEWWQYIAYGAAKKVFEDRLDMDDVQLIMPEFLEQQNLVLRRTIMQNTNQRVATIYTQSTSSGAGPNFSGWGWGGSSF